MMITFTTLSLSRNVLSVILHLRHAERSGKGQSARLISRGAENSSPKADCWDPIVAAMQFCMCKSIEGLYCFDAKFSLHR